MSNNKNDELKLPTWVECSNAIDGHKYREENGIEHGGECYDQLQPNDLVRFIYENEPSPAQNNQGKDADKIFRESLSKALTFAIEENTRSTPPQVEEALKEIDDFYGRFLPLANIHFSAIHSKTVLKELSKIKAILGGEGETNKDEWPEGGFSV